MPTTARLVFPHGRTDPRRRVALRMLAIVLAVLAVHAYGLWSLVRDSASSGPLVILVLVPVAAVAVAWQRAVPGHGGPDIHDRQLDYILGAGLTVAGLTLLVVQDQRAADFTGARLDLLALPLTAAAAAVLLLGTRMTWRLRAALLVLLLAWPPPWEAVVRHLGRPLVAAMTVGYDAVDVGAGRAGGPLLGVVGGLVLGVVGACAFAGSRALRALLAGAGALVGGTLEALSLFVWGVAVRHGQLPVPGPGLAAARQALILLMTAAVLTWLGYGLSRLPRGLERQTRVTASPTAGQVAKAVPRARLAFGVVAVVTGLSVVTELAAAVGGQ